MKTKLFLYSQHSVNIESYKTIKQNNNRKNRKRNADWYSLNHDSCQHFLFVIKCTNDCPPSEWVSVDGVTISSCMGLYNKLGNCGVCIQQQSDQTKHLATNIIHNILLKKNRDFVFSKIIREIQKWKGKLKLKIR